MLADTEAEADQIVEDAGWEACKENSQPLKQGRKSKALAQYAVADQCAADLDTKRKEWEAALRESADGADPLAAWVGYIKWTQEAFLVGGKNAKLMQLLEDCAHGFKDDSRYAEDIRYLRVWIQYADLVRDPEQIFEYLYDRRIGQNYALFWEAWASVLEVKRKYSAADKVRATAAASAARRAPESPLSQPSPTRATRGLAVEMESSPDT